MFLEFFESPEQKERFAERRGVSSTGGEREIFSGCRRGWWRFFVDIGLILTPGEQLISASLNFEGVRGQERGMNNNEAPQGNDTGTRNPGQITEVVENWYTMPTHGK